MTPTPLPTVTGSALHVADGRLWRGGRPVSLRAGSMHYFRVHPAHWRDRMLRLVDLGLDAVDTYVAWNVHRPREDEAARFGGGADLERFLAVAADVGLDAVVRPGPYICAEWTNGGLPVWLTRRRIPLRSSDPRFLGPVLEWFDELVPRIADLQAGRGGPVVAVQVENEFGSFGDDRTYPVLLAQALRDRGIDELLFTADGPTPLMQDGGAVDGVLAAATLGSRPDAARSLLSARRPQEPFVVAEFWNGWFDHWGGRHHVRPAQDAAAVVEDVLRDGGSISLYMAHGGTNLGLGAGANDVDGRVAPTTTSYDSDAPVAEDGRLTAKFHAVRRVLAHGPLGPVRSPDPRFLPPASVPVRRAASLAAVLDHLGTTTGTVTAPTFDDLGLDSGLLRHTARVRLPPGRTTLRLLRVADRAQVRVDGRLVGTVEESGEVTLEGSGDEVDLELLVEAHGRINYGPRLGEPKGLLGPVLVERRMVQGWRTTSLDLTRLTADDLAAVPVTPDPADASDPDDAPVVVLADLAVPATPVGALSADTHLALPGFGKGYAWVGDLLLGRYWHVGPQRTLYVPGPALAAPTTAVALLELERTGPALELRTEPDLGATEVYVEEL